MELSAAYEVENTTSWNTKFEIPRPRFLKVNLNQSDRGKAIDPDGVVRAYGIETLGFKKLFKKAKKATKSRGSKNFFKSVISKVRASKVRAKAITVVASTPPKMVASTPPEIVASTPPEIVARSVIKKERVPVARFTVNRYRYGGGDTVGIMDTRTNRATGGSAGGFGHYLPKSSNWIIGLIGGGVLAAIIIKQIIK